MCIHFSFGWLNNCLLDTVVSFFLSPLFVCKQVLRKELARKKIDLSGQWNHFNGAGYFFFRLSLRCIRNSPLVNKKKNEIILLHSKEKVRRKINHDPGSS